MPAHLRLNIHVFFVPMLACVLALSSACGARRPTLRLKVETGEPITIQPQPITPVELSDAEFRAAMAVLTASWQSPSRPALAGRSLMLASWGPRAESMMRKRLLVPSWQPPEQRSLKLGYAGWCQ